MLIRYFAIATVLALLCPFAAAQTTQRAVGVTIQYGDGSIETVARPATQPDATTPRKFLALNVPTITEYSGIGAAEVCNLVWTSRGFRPPEQPFSYTGGPALDADGNPTGDFGLRLVTDGGARRAGVYAFRAAGDLPTLKVNRPNTIQNIRHVAGRITADIIVPAPADPAARNVTLELVATGTRGGLKDVEVFPPGITDTSKVFTPAFYTATGKPFYGVRFMGAMRTNDSTVVTWAQHLGQKTWSGGLPPTAALTYGVEAKVPVWISVPALADDDYCRQLGTAIRARGSRAPPVYVEYSNEVWNGIYEAYRQNRAATVATTQPVLTDAGRQLTLDGTDRNIEYAAWRRVGRRSIEILELMDAGDSVRLVLPYQVNRGPAGGMLKIQLEYVEKYHGPPSKFFYGTAAAPYYHTGRDPADPKGKRWLTERSDLSVEALVMALIRHAAPSAATVGQIEGNRLTKQYGLKSLGYEVGLDLQQFNTNIPEKIASQYDPRVARSVTEYLRAWYAIGGDEAWWLQSHGAYKRTGYWGLSEDILDLDTPKRDAAEEAAAWLLAGN